MVHNLNLPRKCVPMLLRQPDWYRLFIPKEEMEFNRFDRVRRWEEIAVALLKKYCDRYYKYRKQEWESDHLEYHDLREDDPNFVHEYRLLIEQSQDAIVEKLGELYLLRNMSRGRGIRFYKTIKEIEQRLGDPAVILNSFIISNTPYRQVAWWGQRISKPEREKCHVLFQREDKDTYIDKMLGSLLPTRSGTA